MSTSPTDNVPPTGETPELPADFLDSLFEPTSGPDSQLHLEPDSLFPPATTPNHVGGPEPLRTVSATTSFGTPPAPSPALPEHAGLRLIAGRYRLGKEIARGGMGAVIRAVDEYFDREIAIKLLLADPKSQPDAAARFRGEARVTANLQHPGIPPVHDLGVTPSGRPFLVMKLIQGRTLAEYLLDRESPQHDLPRWVRVFGQVAETVGYAHSRGLIHRDLKPLNVMVGAFGEVQVMDWGLAKYVAHADAPVAASVEAEAFADSRTQAGWVLGTPAYMAPEQARGEVEKVDSRTDVFALGVILTVILTGEPPYRAATPKDVMRLAAAADLTETYERLAACGADPELVAIATLCMAFDPADRPHDGAAVAELVTSHQAAVEARLRKAEADRARGETQLTEQRKRRQVWLGLTVVFLMGTVVSTALAFRAEQMRLEAGIAHAEEKDAREKEAAQRRLAEANAKEANDARGRAVVAEAQARADRDRAVEAEADTNAFSTFLVTRVLAACRPEGAGHGIGVDIKMSEVLKAAEARFDDVFKGRPRAEAEARVALGVTWKDLGRYREAEPHLVRALALQAEAFGPDHPKTLATTLKLARVFLESGREEQALVMVRRVRDFRTQALGAEHPDTLAAREDLATFLSRTGKHKEAIPELKRILDARVRASGPTAPDVLATLDHLARAHEADRNYPEAVKVLERVRGARAAEKGVSHIMTLTAERQLGSAYVAVGRADEGIALLESVLASERRVLGETHPETLNTLEALASAYLRLGKRGRGVEYMELANAGARKQFGPHHPTTLVSLANLAVLYERQQRWKDAIRAWDEAVPRLQEALGADHPIPVHNRRLWVAALERDEQWDRAATIRIEIVEADRLVRARDDPKDVERFSVPLLRAVQALVHAGRAAEAEPYLREWFELNPDKPGATSAEAKSMLGESLLRQGKYAEAEPLLVDAYARWRGGFKAQTEQQREFVERWSIDSADLGCALYRAWGKPEALARWQKERAKYPPTPAPRPREVKP